MIFIVLWISPFLLVLKRVLKIRLCIIWVILYFIQSISFLWIVHYIRKIILVLKISCYLLWCKYISNFWVIYFISNRLKMLSIWCLCSNRLFFKFYDILAHNWQLSEVLLKIIAFLFNVQKNWRLSLLLC